MTRLAGGLARRVQMLELLKSLDAAGKPAG
jgi:hypothetical protein